jgi:hypothetical protein
MDALHYVCINYFGSEHGKKKEAEEKMKCKNFKIEIQQM